MTGLDAANRARLIRDHGATEGLLDYLEGEGFEPGQITAAFAAMTVEQIASKVGYDVAADPDYAAPAAAAASPRAARASARAATAPRAAAAPRARARRSRSGQDGYRVFTYGLALAFGLAIATLMWRVDGYFGVSFVQRIPGLREIPNTVFWPPVWTWVIGLGVSSLQGAFWPHKAVYDDEGALLEAGSTPQEIITWLVVLFANIASSALGMMPTIAGMDLRGVVVPTEGRFLWATAWTLALVFALYPEWAARVFGARLWDLLVPDSLKHRIRAMKSGIGAAWGVLGSLVPTNTQHRMIAGGVVGSLVLFVVVWRMLA